MSDNIIWLAAYPKTGSTWLRTILQQLLAPKMRGKDAIPSFDCDYPEDAPPHAAMETQAKVLRTHCHPEHKCFRALQEGRSDRIVGVLTIQRHPLDVLLSQLNYAFVLQRENSFKNKALKNVQEIISDGEIDYYIDAFIRAEGCPEHVGRCKSYAGFYEQWRELAPDAPHLHLRYEDLVKDPQRGVEALINFLRIPQIDPSAVVDAVESRTRLNGKFFWRKRAYNHLELLPESSIRLFEQGYSGALRALGYAPSRV